MATHVLLTGGRLHVPEEDRVAFLEAYAADVASGRELHVVERTVGGTYSMFADIDLKATDGASAAALAAAVLEITVGALPPELRRQAVVCSRRWSPADRKIGMHFTFGGLRVNDAAARRLRDLWVHAIACSPCAGSGREWWEGAIDAAVYRNNGLRMPWSHKGKGSGPETVYVPSHTIEVVDGTPVVRRAEVAVAADMHEIVRWLQMASLRAGPGEATAVAATPPRRPLSHRSKTEGIPDEYRDSVTGARRLCTGAVAVSLSSRSCRIAGRDHSSNHVYLLVYDDGRVVQRCHSAKCAGREHVLRYTMGTRASGCVAVPGETGRAAATRASQFWARKIL